MFTPREICLLVLLPGVIGLLAAWLASRRTAWPAALTLGGSILLAGLLTSGIHGRPREAFDWLVLVPALAAVAGILLTWIPGLFGIILVAGAGALIAWLLAVPGITMADMIAAAAAPGILYAILALASRRNSGAVLPASWLIVAASTTCVSMASTGITFGKYTMALPAVIGGILVAAFLTRKVILSPGGLAAFVLIWISLLVYGYEWVDVPRWRVLVLLAAPLGIWLGELPGIAPRPALRAVVSLACVAALAAAAAVPAAIELLQLLRSQTQVGGY